MSVWERPDKAWERKGGGRGVRCQRWVRDGRMIVAPAERSPAHILLLAVIALDHRSSSFLHHYSRFLRFLPDGPRWMGGGAQDPYPHHSVVSIDEMFRSFTFIWSSLLFDDDDDDDDSLFYSIYLLAHTFELLPSNCNMGRLTWFCSSHSHFKDDWNCGYCDWSTSVLRIAFSYLLSFNLFVFFRILPDGLR